MMTRRPPIPTALLPLLLLLIVTLLLGLVPQRAALADEALPLAAPSAFAAQQYRDFLGRDAEPAGLQYWIAALESGRLTRAQVVDSFFRSPEFQNGIAPLARLYFAYFNRLPDYPGLLYWIEQYRGGAPLDAMSQAFANSPEFGQTYGALSDAQFVELVYANVLGRPAEPAGRAYWIGKLNEGLSRGQLMIGFSESPEYRQRSFSWIQVTMMYVGLLRRAPEREGFDYWVPRLERGESVLGLIGGFLAAEEYARRFCAGIGGQCFTGTLQVNLEPADAVADGARWRRVGTETWLASGAVETGIPIGHYNLEFLEVEGWHPPGQTQVAIGVDRPAWFSGNYDPWVGVDLTNEGFEGRTLLHPIVVNHPFEQEPPWIFEIAEGSDGLSLVGDNQDLLSYEAPLGSGGEAVEFRLRITNPNDGRVFEAPGRFDILTTEILAQGQIGPAGGEVLDAVSGARLTVPAGAVDRNVLFMIVRGLDDTGVQTYSVQVEPAEAEIRAPLQLVLPPAEAQGVSALEADQPAAADERAFAPMFVSSGWTEWETGKARMLKVEKTAGVVAMNRIPKESNYCYMLYREFGLLTSPLTSCSDNTLIWRLSSRCGARPANGFDASHPCHGRTPVLFVHGYQTYANGIAPEGKDVLHGGDDYWNALPSLLDEAGYAVFGFQWRTSQRFQDAAADLATAIAQIRAATWQPVYLITHSFGGLVARAYLQGLATDQPYRQHDVAKLVTIATPHSGIADEGVVNGVRLPRGRSQGGWTIDYCQQLSCYQAGKASTLAYMVDSSSGTHDLRRYFGVDPNRSGEIPARLASTSSSMPVPMLALYGLTWETITPDSGSRYSLLAEGDGLISWEGQRAHPAFSCPDTQQTCQATVIGSQNRSGWFPAGLTERVLGVEYLDYINRVAPGFILEAIDYRSKGGYRHSDSVPIRFHGYIKQLDITSENYVYSSTYSAIRDWLTGSIEDLVEVERTGSGQGRVTSDLAGIDCGSSCSALFESGARVTLTATAAPGSTFTGWGGACVTRGNLPTCELWRVSTPLSASVTARFESREVTTWSLSPSSLVASETGGTARFTLRRSTTGTAQRVYVSTVQDRGWRNDNDYVGILNQPLSFAAGEAERAIEVTILADNRTEGDETFGLIVQQAPGDPISQYLAGSTFTIRDGASPPSGYAPLNDTGIDWCANETTNFLACPVGGYPGQDGQFGRDATHNDDRDGQAGFSFAKLDANGNALPNSATTWSCVRDNVTGLVWEVKTDDGGLRDKDWTYSWYNPDPTTNGGDAGTADGGNNCFDPARCDTHKFVADVNAQRLCGASDWRLPSVDELLSIVDNGRVNPAIDTAFFPNTPEWFWSSSPGAYLSNLAWGLSIYNGFVGYGPKNYQPSVLLVRGGQ